MQRSVAILTRIAHDSDQQVQHDEDNKKCEDDEQGCG
jgi:hypothetical protein